MKKKIIFFGKFFFAAGLLAWLIHSGKLDIQQTKLIWEKKGFFFLIVIPVLFFCTILQNFRWWLILSCFAVHFSLRSLFTLTWIGNFFNIVLPGLVSGDILKGIYLQKRTHTTWVKVYASLLLDRVMGLLGLFLLFLISSILFLLENQNLFQQFFLFVLIGLIGLGAFFVFVFFPRIKIQKNFPKLPKFFHKKIFITLIECFSIIRCNKKKILYTFLISTIIHLIILLLIYQISTFLFTQTLSFWKQALIIPLGLVVTALPISPAGIGVGHIAFENFYQWFNFSGGATLFNIFIINQILVFLSGIIPFIFYKKRAEKKL